jgi:hypothetical protein
VPRPLPHIPRGPRRPRPKRHRLLFACPRISPEWELATLSVLMKPKLHTRAALEHRGAGEQHWPPHADAALDHALAVVHDRLGLSLTIHRPAAGEYFFLAEFARPQRPAMLALALLLSAALPDLWFALDHLFVRNGAFHRRQFGYKLNLVQASNVHLPRETRAALKGILTPHPHPTPYTIPRAQCLAPSTPSSPTS